MKKLYSLTLMGALLGVAGQMAAEPIEVGENQLWYGYYKGTEPIAGLGVGMPNTDQMVNNAIFIDGKDPVYQGKIIKGLRFKIQGKGDIDNVSGWLSADLNVPVDEDLIMSVAYDTEALMDSVWTEIALPEGYAIPEEGVYAGYSLHSKSQLRTSQFPGFCTSDRIAPDGALFNFETGFMSGWQSYGDRMGKLCYQVLLEGDFPKNAISVGEFGKHYVVKGDKIMVSLPAINMGSDGVADIDYVVVTDGVKGEEQHLVLDSKFDIYGGAFTIDIPLEADNDTKLASKEIVITKVNGFSNESEQSVAAGSLVTLSRLEERKIVAETYTGTWCGWCPRAIVGINKLKEIYGDQLIVIDAHVGMSDYTDPMTIPAYEDIKDDRIGYPQVFFNREVNGDPYTGAERVEEFLSPQLVEKVLANAPEGSIQISADWANVPQTRVKVTSEVTMLFDAEGVDYRIAYVVKSDGLSGEGEEWSQSNFFSYFVDDEEYAPDTQLGQDFEYFLNSPELIEDMVYDDVAAAAYGLSEGMPETIPTSIQADVPMAS